ncbi:PPOX class F420-dependent oxidoreductase [Nonomuraea sp. NPDC004297]
MPVTIPDGFQDLLQRPLIAHFATVRADGTPQVNPMWFAWEGGRLRFTSTRHRYKHRNVLANRRVAASVADPTDLYRYLEIGGVVESIDPDPEGMFWMYLARRYESPTGLPPDVRDRVVYVVQPVRMVSFTRRTSWSPLAPVVES